MSTILLFVLFFIPGADYHSYESAPNALAQMMNSPALFAAVLGSLFSVAFFNFFGITITKRVSSLARSTIDNMRTITIWLISMAVGWEVFSWLQCTTCNMNNNIL